MTVRKTAIKKYLVQRFVSDNIRRSFFDKTPKYCQKRKTETAGNRIGITFRSQQRLKINYVIIYTWYLSILYHEVRTPHVASHS